MYHMLAHGIDLPGAAELLADTDDTMISESNSISPYVNRFYAVFILHMAH